MLPLKEPMNTRQNALRNADGLVRQYKAVALYERSKSLYHLVRLVPGNEQNRKACLEGAERLLAIRRKEVLDLRSKQGCPARPRLACRY
jgi:hypothetical protein